jgi:hypothetical protein
VAVLLTALTSHHFFEGIFEGIFQNSAQFLLVMSLWTETPNKNVTYLESLGVESAWKKALKSGRRA